MLIICDCFLILFVRNCGGCDLRIIVVQNIILQAFLLDIDAPFALFQLCVPGIRLIRVFGADALPHPTDVFV